jgi:eukaryotic-like serine/threonine-protein kinase
VFSYHDNVVGSVTGGTDALVGRVVGERYRIVRKIGRGGMGSIYEVEHLRLGRQFALKTLSVDLARDAEALARFKREADAISKLRHPNVVEIVDWETLDDGSPCMVMELLHGEDLAAYLRQTGPLGWPALARIADQVMSALAAAHRGGITHRDIKPQNIFLATDDSGEIRVKLLDFGVSKFHEAETGLTSNQQVLGTPTHMAPEQIEGAVDKIGPASDVWAMATILFEMATGQAPFRAPTVPAILYQICHGSARAPSSLRSDAPRAFDELIGRALSRDAALRTTSIDWLRADLREALGPVAPGAFVEPLRVLKRPRARANHHTPLPLPTTMTRASGQVRGTPTPLPSVLSGGRRETLLVACVAALLPIILIVALWPRGSHREISASDPTTGAGLSSVTTAPSTPVAAVSSPPVTSVAPPSVSVRIESSPPGADVYEGARRLGETPWSTETELNVVRELVLKRAGYRDEVVRIDGTRARLPISLETVFSLEESADRRRDIASKKLGAGKQRTASKQRTARKRTASDNPTASSKVKPQTAKPTAASVTTATPATAAPASPVAVPAKPAAPSKPMRQAHDSENPFE